jgi:hypothetical protein
MIFDKVHHMFRIRIRIHNLNLRIRIRILQNVRILMDTDSDPQHWYKQKNQLLALINCFPDNCLSDVNFFFTALVSLCHRYQY